MIYGNIRKYRKKGMDNPGPIKLLLIEDDGVDARIILRNLSQSDLHFDSTWAANVTAAKSLINAETYDCILLDYFFPEGNAFEVFSKLLKESCSKRPAIILLTGIGNEGIAAQSIQIGAQEYLSKSEITPWNLTKLIESAREKSSLQRQLENRDQAHQKLSFFDSLTELPNRQLFLDRLEQSIYKTERQGLPFAVLMMDLDLFKDVNDSFGHEAGDQILKQVSARLSQSMRESDTVARLGGNEFAAILMSIFSDSDAISVIENNKKYCPTFQYRRSTG
ncbi:MAG: diguanylate cyclase (GGDEF)-like protein [Gammaproteobacteria bacterium]|jgi:diguanylate cyclase (GGDEF)-like protein